jgi:hypothetical protein
MIIRGSNTGVELFPHKHKVKGLSPAAAADSGKEKRDKKVF